MSAKLQISDKVYTLNNGRIIPAVGFGTWQVTEDQDAFTVVKTALDVGYKHIDTAAAYDNEKHVGRAIKESGIKREDLFVTTKLWCKDFLDVEKALDTSLQNLGLDYVDLYLMHWPVALNPNGIGKFAAKPNGDRDVLDLSYVEVYKNLQKLLDTGKVKSIGVSNFSKKRLEELLNDKDVTVKPVVNQIEAHPLLPQPKLFDYCKEKDILIEAYSPLGSTDSPLFKNETIKEIADKNGVEPAQVLISWALARDTVVLPKSATPSRIKSNFQTFVLSKEDKETLDNMVSKYGVTRTCNPNFSSVVIFNDEE